MTLNRSMWLLIPAAAGALVAGCGGPGGKSARADTKQALEARIPVYLASVSLHPMQQTVRVTGSLDTLDDVTLSPKIAGRLAMVLKQEGDHVHAGELVATQETTELRTQVRQAQAGLAAARSNLAQAKQDAASSPVSTEAGIRRAESAVAQAKAQLKKTLDGARPQEIAQAQKGVDQANASLDWSQKDYQRLSDLYAQNAVSKQQLDLAQTNLDAAKARYDSAVEALSLVKAGSRQEDIDTAREAVRQAQESLIQAQTARVNDTIKQEKVQASLAAVTQAQSAVQLARDQIENTRIYSPVTGQVETRQAQPGQMVLPGTPVMRIVSLNGVYFEGNVSETDIRLVRSGQAAKVAIDAYPGELFVGHVVAVRPVGNDQARLFAVRIALSDGTSRLKPGMFARGDLVVQTVPNAVVVPKDALVSRFGETSVYVVEGDVAHARKVQTGLTNTDHVQVTGVTLGEKVVVKGTDTLTDGAKVRVDQPGANGEQVSADGTIGK